jgi:hypothetical protein
MRLRMANSNFGQLREGLTIEQTKETIGPFFDRPVADSFFRDTKDGSFRLENELYVLIFKDDKLKCWKWHGDNYVWHDWFLGQNFSPCARLNDQLKKPR